MEIQELQVVGGLRKLDIRLDNDKILSTPRQAITTTNLNHSEEVNYKTPFLEILITSINNLRVKADYDVEVKRSKKIIKNHSNKKIITTIKGIASRTIKVSDFKLLCKFQKDIGLSDIRLFFRENLYEKIDELIKWVDSEIGKYHSFVLDHNINLTDFKRLYLLALKREHGEIYFINRKPTKNNKEKFLFIQGRTNDKIIRWISLLNKKAEKGSLNSLFYYWLGYDITAFTTRTGRYHVPESELEIIKDFRFVPISQFSGEQCAMFPNHTLSQSIEEYSLRKRDSIPCSVFSIVELNTNFENFAQNIDINHVTELIVEDIKHFKELVPQSLQT